MARGLRAAPVEIVIQIIGNLDTPRDLRAFGLACRRIYQLVEDEGWKQLVPKLFPSLRAAPTEHQTWKERARSIKAPP